MKEQTQQIVVSVILIFLSGLFGYTLGVHTVQPEGPVSATYAQRVVRAIDHTQAAAWEVAYTDPTDGMMQWYNHITKELSDIECELIPQDCN